jgi:methyl-accepting chemotaxis protein
MQHFSILNVIKLQLGLVIIVSSIAFYTNWTASNTVNEANHYLVKDVTPFQLDTLAFRLHVIQVQQWLTDISATRGQDGLDDGFQEAAHHAEEALATIDRLEEVDQTHQSIYRTVRRIFNAYYTTGQEMARRYIADGPAGGNPFMSEFDAAVEEMNEQIDILTTQADKTTITTSDRIQNSLSQLHLSLLIGSVMLILVVWLGLLLILRLLSPLKDLTKQAKTIAQNDLRLITVSDQKKLSVELETLTQAILAMHHNLRQSVGAMNDSSSYLSVAVQNLNQVTETNQVSMAKQREQIDNVADSVHAMITMTQDIAEQTTDNATSANQAMVTVSQGEQIITNTIEAIQSLANEVLRAVETIADLKQKSENIGSVLDVIRGIAEQTNLLALNAAIEAARAGEQGRGFAVVADEVRQLASRTASSTIEIQHIIQQLQQGANTAVAIVQTSQDQAHTTIDHAQTSAQVLSDIHQIVHKISIISEQTASITARQKELAGSVCHDIDVIQEAASTLVNSIQQIVDTGQMVTEHTHKLTTIVEQFQL